MHVTVAKQVETFFGSYTKRSYRRSEILIRSAEDPSGIFYLSQGIVKTYTLSKRGDEHVINVFKAGAFFPISWAITELPNEYFYEAVTDITVYVAPKNAVVAFLKHNPAVVYDLLERVFLGIDGMLKRMTYLMAGNAYLRLITEIIIHVKRFGSIDPTGRAVIQFSEKDIATELGMTRETVSREIKFLKQKQVVSFQKNILIVHNLHTLEEELHKGTSGLI